MSAVARSLTVEDLESLPNDGRRYEIVNGEFFMSPAPDIIHQSLVVALTLLLGNHVAGRSEMRLFVAPVDVRFSSIDQVQADLLLIHKDRMSMYQGSTVSGAPDLVIEVISPSSRIYDEIVKFGLYERSGVPEYWIVDPVEKSIKIMVLRNGHYEQQPDENNGPSSNVLPQLIIDSAKLFSDLDD